MPLNDMERTELRRFCDRVREGLGGRSVQVTLFGSKARGDDRSDSDLDVLVLVPRDDLQARKRVCSLAMDALLDAGVLISPKIISRRRFRQMKSEGSPFARSVVQDGIKI